MGAAPAESSLTFTIDGLTMVISGAGDLGQLLAQEGIDEAEESETEDELELDFSLGMAIGQAVLAD